MKDVGRKIVNARKRKLWRTKECANRHNFLHMIRVRYSLNHMPLVFSGYDCVMCQIITIWSLH